MDTKNLSTLVEDIENVLLQGFNVSDNEMGDFLSSIKNSTIEAFSKREIKSGLRMSSIGQPCERKLWYENNEPKSAIPLRPEHYLKFYYGTILEELLIFLAERAGHRVEGRQTELDIRGIKGHRDVIIDGVTIDVKSASTYSFRKFREGLKPETDSFGYLEQLRSYTYAGRGDSLVTEKNKGAFLVIDKTLGHVHLDVHEFDFTGIEETYERKKALVASKELPPRGFTAEPLGKSGNMALGINCSYCPFSKVCWPEQRTFLYANGPKTLVVVNKEPLVPELKHIDVIDTEIE